MKKGHQKQRGTDGFWSHTLCGRIIPALGEEGWTVGVWCAAFPAPSAEAAPRRPRREQLCPPVPNRILPFSILKKRFFFFPSLFRAPPLISLTMHIRDRKHMLTIPKIDHCGIKINYRYAETLMQAFWSSRLFLCNAERVIKHHFP